MVNNYKMVLGIIEEIESSLSKLQYLLNEIKSFIQNQRRSTELNKEEYNTLTRYRIVFENHIMWESRKEYFEIINGFLNNRIDGEEFCNLFLTLHYENCDKASQAEENLQHKTDFQLTSKSINFSNLMETLFALVETFDPDIKDIESNDFGLSENGLRSSIKKHIIPIFSNYYDQSS